MTCSAGADPRARGPWPHIAVLAWTGLVLVLSSAQASAAGCKDRPAGDLTNLFLGPRYAQWLVGPVACMARDDEIRDFLALQSDEEAARFINGFWQRRDPDPDRGGNKVRELFDERAAEADKKFLEGTYLGRRTDRGTVFILYGPPEEISYEEFRNVREPNVELWKYPKRAQPGLDGRRPERSYRFAKQGDLTSFYKPSRSRDSRLQEPGLRNPGRLPSRLPPPPPPRR